MKIGDLVQSRPFKPHLGIGIIIATHSSLTQMIIVRWASGREQWVNTCMLQAVKKCP